MIRTRSVALSRFATAAACVALLGCETSEQLDDATGADAGTIYDAGVSDAGDVGVEDTHDDAGDATPWAFCEGTTAHRYDPFKADELLLFPDDIYTVLDPDSPTGVRVNLDEESAPWVAEVPTLLRSVVTDAQVLSGFGSNAAVVLRFDAPVTSWPRSAEGSQTSPALYFLDLSTSPPTRVPYEVAVGDDGLDAMVWPLRPLTLGAQHALILTNAQRADDGQCVRPSEATRALLLGADAQTNDRAARAATAWTAALEAMRISPQTVSAITTFTVHDDLGPLVAAADDIRAQAPAEWGETTCEAWREGLRCETSVKTRDYRAEGYIRDGAPHGSWTLPTTVWLPPGPGPFPVLYFGHGLNDSRGSGQSVANVVGPLGIAVIATDALGHGDHPTYPENSPLPALDFLGIDLSSLSLQTLRLRGNFNQTNLDRLQVLHTALAHTDVNGDGAADFDPERVAYWGISLGGMLGSGFAALSADLDVAILSVAGGRLLTFATDTEQVASAMPALIQVIGSKALFERLLAVAQCLVDPADPATMAATILSGTLHEGTGPSVLFPVALRDETVPPATGRALARALGAPQVGEVFDPVAVIPLGEAPVLGNAGSETQTAAYMQFDRVTRGGTQVPATHGNMPLSLEAKEQAVHFFQSWLETGVPEIIDPYFVLGTPALLE